MTEQKSIDRKKLSEQILKTYRFHTEVSSKNYANQICDELLPKFIPLLQAWMDQEPLPEIKEDEFDVNLIMKIQRNHDFLRALRLLNLYAKDPQRGRKGIWSPPGRFII